MEDEQAGDGRAGRGAAARGPGASETAPASASPKMPMTREQVARLHEPGLPVSSWW